MPNFEAHCRCPGCGTCDSHDRAEKLEAILIDLLDDCALEHETKKYGVYQIGHDSMTAARREYLAIKRRGDPT